MQKVIAEDHSYLNHIRTDPYYKGVYANSLFKALYLNQVSPKDSRYNICKEPYSTYPIVIYAKKNFYLIDALNEKISLMQAAGLIEFWYYQDLDIRYLVTTFTEPLKTLTMKHLGGCFQILFFGLALSFLAFILELLSDIRSTFKSLRVE